MRIHGKSEKRTLSRFFRPIFPSFTFYCIYVACFYIVILACDLIMDSRLTATGPETLEDILGFFLAPIVLPAMGIISWPLVVLSFIGRPSGLNFALESFIVVAGIICSVSMFFAYRKLRLLVDEPDFSKLNIIIYSITMFVSLSFFGYFGALIGQAG